MTEYEWLLQFAHERGFAVIEKFDLGKLSGLVAKDVIGLSDKLENEKERKCILAEEIAHTELNIGDITNLSGISNRKQEIRAHKLAVKMLLPFDRLVDTIIKMREETSVYSLAHELDVTEEFLMEAIELYSYEYGPKVDYGAYIVFFHPFHIAEKQKT